MLRVIAVDRALHFVGLVIIGVAILLLASTGRATADVTRSSTPSRGTSGQTKPHGILGELYKLTNIGTATLYEAGRGGSSTPCSRAQRRWACGGPSAGPST